MNKEDIGKQNISKCNNETNQCTPNQILTKIWLTLLTCFWRRSLWVEHYFNKNQPPSPSPKKKKKNIKRKSKNIIVYIFFYLFLIAEFTRYLTIILTNKLLELEWYLFRLTINVPKIKLNKTLTMRIISSGH